MRLLRLALLAVALFVSTNTLLAQPFSLGISGGSSHSDYNLRGYRGAITNRTGFHVGVGASLKIPIFTISSELIYTNNKFDISDPKVMGSQCEVRDQRLDVPVLVGLNILGPLIIEAGPLFTIYDRADVAYNGAIDYTENIGRILPEKGYVVGLKLALGEKVQLGARYYGSADSYRFSNSGYDIRSNSYTLSIGFKL